MLRWALFYLAVAVVAGGIGLSGPAGIEASAARILAAASVVLLVLSLVAWRRAPAA